MKKTMFITSVIMVIVMAIALTTSSLAWFSAVGATQVTTSAMTLSAKSTAASGLLISSVSEVGAWYSNIDLVSGNAQAKMVPAVPYQEATDDTMLIALRDTNFITNKVDMNGKFSGTAVTANSGDGSGANDAILYFTKDIWITTVDTENNLYITPSIDWYSAYTDETTNTTYTPSSEDPVVYVAVLADKNAVVQADRSAADATRDWEIVTIFASTGAASVNFGGEAEAFDDGATYSSACSQPTVASLNLASGHTTDTLAKVTTDATTGAQLTTGEAKLFRIVAWYDGPSLVNGNSNFNVIFNLTFEGGH